MSEIIEDIGSELLKLKVKYIRSLLEFSKLELPDSFRRFNGLAKANSFGDVLDFVDGRQEYWQDDLCVVILGELVNFFSSQVDMVKKEVDVFTADSLKIILNLQDDDVRLKKEIIFYKDKYRGLQDMKFVVETVVAGLSNLAIIIKKYNDNPGVKEDVIMLEGFINLMIAGTNSIIDNYSDIVSKLDKDSVTEDSDGANDVVGSPVISQTLGSAAEKIDIEGNSTTKTKTITDEMVKEWKLRREKKSSK